MDQIFTIKQLLKQEICPIGKTRLMNLIRLGERQKEGDLPEGLNYILAVNVGNGAKRARWAVNKSEIDAWLERAKNTTKGGEWEAR